MNHPDPAPTAAATSEDPWPSGATFHIADTETPVEFGVAAKATLEKILSESSSDAAPGTRSRWVGSGMRVAPRA